MIKTTLPNEVILARYKSQLKDWEVAQLDASIIHETYQAIGSSNDVLEQCAKRVVETAKAIRAIKLRIDELEKSVKENTNGRVTDVEEVS